LSHHVRRIPLLTAIGVLAAFALLVAGCGSSDDSSSTAAETTSSTDAGATASSGASGGEQVKISETEYKLSPSDVTVKPGTVTFEVTNDGQTVHNLEIEGPDDEQELASDLQPGDSGEVSVDLSTPGTYEMYCPVDDHKGMGMTGEITVKG
jgi:uncharacterized cupredoxin-like copper-binding protein